MITAWVRSRAKARTMGSKNPCFEQVRCADLTTLPSQPSQETADTADGHLKTVKVTSAKIVSCISKCQS